MIAAGVVRWAEACLVNFLLRPCSASWDVSAESPTLHGLSFANHSSLRRCRGALSPAGPRHLKPGLSRSRCSLTDGFLRVVQKGRCLERRCKVVPQALLDCKARRQDKNARGFSRGSSPTACIAATPSPSLPLTQVQESPVL